MKQYVQTDLEADCEVANTLAELMIGGCASFYRSRRREWRLPPGRDGVRRGFISKSVYKPHAEGPFLFEKGPLALVAGEGFEPSTSGL